MEQRQRRRRERWVVLAVLAAVGLAVPPGRVRAAMPGEFVDAPPSLAVPAGHTPYLSADAVGTQNYICLPSASGVAWVHVGPQATLFGRGTRQLTTHFLDVNPMEGVARAAWQHSVDSSRVWARAVASSSDPAWVAPGAVPWLLLETMGADGGPRGRGQLAGTSYIQRVQTSGGVAPAVGCAQAADVGARAFVPYTTVYVFYRPAGR